MMESKNCIKCKEEIPPLRLKALPGARTCVECSTTGAKKGVPVMFGTKDNTWTDLVVMEDKDFQQYKEREKNSKKGLDKFSD